MLTTIKALFLSWNTWIILGIILSATGGIYLIAHGRGYDRGLKVGLDRLEAHHERMQELLAKEQERQIEYVTIREPIITERVVYIDKVRTEYETLIAANPSPVECRMPTERVRAFNRIGQGPD